MKIAPASSVWDSEVRLLAWLATCVSVLAFLFYFQRGDVLLYGDAVAHLNIARRVFDSKTPGLLQLGTVWLPLPHLLIMPFIVSTRMWQSGAGGSIPSMASYVLGVLGIFRLVRAAPSKDGIDEGERIAPWAAAILYGANPNLIYIQATAMGESVYLAWFIWAVVYFAEFARSKAKQIESSTRSLTKCGFCLPGACLTRYDGWFLAGVLVATTVFAAFLFRNVRQDETPVSVSPSRIAMPKFVLIAAAAPVFWLGYNAAVYRN